MSYTIVGVIGHIDHGKTSLVAAMSGIDTDTHPEEKRRGITIDLGFASFSSGADQFALIDAPGHQKYIGNLLAGVASVDIGLLVIACDQGVQAQTIEHTAILNSLGVEHLIVALTRTDLSSENQRQEIREEMEYFLAEQGIEQFDTVFTSTETGEGIEELKSLLVQNRRTERRSASGYFRMPIDRVFTREGRGLVVAGTIWNGSVSVGDELRVARTGHLARVRHLEVHGESVESSNAGLRTAMNLTGTHRSQVQRGDELIAPDSYSLCSRFLANLRLFDAAGPIRCPAEFLFHTATKQCEARITGPKDLVANRENTVIIHTNEPVLFSYGQPFLLRSPYPVGSVASGQFMDPLDGIDKKTSQILEIANQHRDTDRSSSLKRRVHLCDQIQVTDPRIETEMGISTDTLEQHLKMAVADPTLQRQGDMLISVHATEKAKQLILSKLTQKSSENDYWMDEGAILDWVSKRLTQEIATITIDRMINDREVVRSNHLVALRTDQTSLSKKQTAALSTVLNSLEGNRTPPLLKELAELTKHNSESLQSLLRFAAQQHLIIPIDDQLYYHTATLVTFKAELNTLFAMAPNRTVAEIRDHLKITRKYAIPLLQYFDREQITLRNGDFRTAGPEL